MFSKAPVIDLRELSSIEEITRDLSLKGISLGESLKKERSLTASILESFLIGLNNQIHEKKDSIKVYLVIRNLGDSYECLLCLVSKEKEEDFLENITGEKGEIIVPSFGYKPGRAVYLSYKAYLQRAISNNPDFDYVEETLEIMKNFFKKMGYVTDYD